MCIFFSSSVYLVLARKRDRATKKRSSRSDIFLSEWGPRQNLHMQCFGGEKRRQASLLCRHAASVATALPHAQPDIALQYFRGGIAAGNVGALEDTKKSIKTPDAR